MEKLNSNKRMIGYLLLGVAIGGALGASLGILFAPGKGSETRQKHAAFRKRLVNFVKTKFKTLANSAKREVVA